MELEAHASFWAHGTGVTAKKLLAAQSALNGGYNVLVKYELTCELTCRARLILLDRQPITD
jgi:hypothetical protein